jgi:hypothetical protein
VAFFLGLLEGDQGKFSAISALLSHFASSHRRPVGCGFESHSFAAGI